MSALASQVYDEVFASKQKALLNPTWFFETIVHEELEPKQLEAIEAIADVHRKARGIKTKYNHEGLPRISVVSCHGTGKTRFLGQVAHWWNYCFYGKAVVTAPKEKQIRTRFMPRYRDILGLAEPWYKKLIFTTSLEVKIAGNDDWGLIGETASDAENMQGYHDKPQLFLVDEASARVLDPMFPVIEGALTTVGSVLVMIGNPTRTTGEFYNSHKKRGVKELYYRMHIKHTDSKYVSLEWVKTMCKKYGANSPIYKVRALGEFADMEDNQLLAMGWLEDARNKDIDVKGENFTVRISADIQDGGEDESIYIVAFKYQTYTVFKKMVRKSFAALTATDDNVDAIVELIKSIPEFDKERDDIVVDSIGVGTGVASRLIRMGYNVVRYKGGADSDNNKKYRNRRVQSYLVYRDELVDGNIYYEDDFCDSESWDDYISQALTIRTKPSIERIEDLLTKQEMRSLSIDSPDMPDSTVMVFATQTPQSFSNGGTDELVIINDSLNDNYDAGLT